MSTLTLPQLIAKIVEKGVFTSQEVQNLVFGFGELVTHSLKRGESVTIDDLGTFRCSLVSGNVEVEFAPDSVLASKINAPFAMFEPMELPADVTEDDIELDDIEVFSDGLDSDSSELADGEKGMNEENISAEHVEEADETFDAEAKNIAPPIIANPTDKIEQSQTLSVGAEHTAHFNHTTSDSKHTTSESKSTDVCKGENITSCANNKKNSESNPIDDSSSCSTTQLPDIPKVEKFIERERVVEIHPDGSHHSLSVILTAILSLLVGLIIGYFMAPKVNFDNVKNVNIEAADVQVYPSTIQNKSSIESEECSTVATDSTEVESDVEAKSSVPLSAKVITDTIRANRYLTTMALQHYGKKKFWVYIYMENRNIISDPDNIPPFTVVTIPPSEKYGIEPGNAASENKAEQLATEIYHNR